MLKAILVVFVALWLLGFVHISILNFPILPFGFFTFTLQNLLLLFIICFFIGFLSGILRTIVIILLVLWLLSTFGFALISGLGHIILLILIVVVIFSLV